MLSLRTAKSASVIWATILLAGWIGWPSTGCFCEDGGFRFFCDAHRHGSSSARVHQASDGLRGCCDHSRSVAQRDCCERSASASRRVSNPGCTPVTKPPVIAPLVTSKHIPTDEVVALCTLPVEARPTSAAFAATQPAQLDTGPPVDLVISLQCLLI